MSESFALETWRDELEHRKRLQMNYVDRIPLPLFEKMLAAYEKRQRWAMFWKRVFTIKPHEVIGPQENPYLLRWRVFPKSPLPNLYIHKIMRSDAGTDLHDHRYASCSVILKGGYLEVLPLNTRIGQVFGLTETRRRKPGAVIFRSAKQLHRLVIEQDKHCWSLFFTWFGVRDWGFQTSAGWMHWKQYLRENPDRA